MADSDEVVSKGDFAKLCGVSPGRITQWIDEGKISGDGLVGEGRSAKIRVAVARRQVNLRRDVGQALGNGLGTKLKTTPPPTPVTAPPPAAPKAPAAPKLPRPAEVLYDQEPEDHAGDGGDDVDRKLKLAKLETAERANRMAALEEAGKTGLYTETAAARSDMGRIASQIIRIVEGALPEIATAIAAQFKLEARDVTHHLNEQFRKVREQAAEAAEQAARALPELVDAA